MAKGFRGVKNDLSELGRHLLDIACFLSPLLSATAHNHRDTSSSFPRVLPDLAEVRGGFRAGLSRLSAASSSNSHSAAPSALAEVSKEVREFVEDLVKCPESWLEFPVPLSDYFEISHPQIEHIAVIEHVVPSLATLKDDLCPKSMTEYSFWKIYFALLHPKLNKHEAEVLSTQQIIDEMKIAWKKMEGNANYPTQNQNPAVDINDERDDNLVEENQMQEVSTTTEMAPSQHFIDCQIDNPSESDAASCDTRKHLQSEDDVSFSGTEDEDHVMVMRHLSSVKAGQASSSTTNWVQLRKRNYSTSRACTSTTWLIYEGKEQVEPESSKWQNVEDSDFELVDR